VPLRPNTSADFLRFTNDGRLFYGFRNFGNDIFATRLDPATGRAQEASLLVDAVVGSNQSPAWSPDGQRLAFMRRHGGTVTEVFSLVLRDVGAGRERVVERSLDDGLYPRLRWYPDGRSVFGRDRRGFKTIDLETGAQRPLFTAPRAAGEVTLQWDMSPDGRFLFYRQARRETPSSTAVVNLMKRDLETGAEVSLTHGTALRVTIQGIVVSPDGRHLAVQFAGVGLALVPTDGGEPVVLQPGDGALPGPLKLWPLAFSADGRHVLASRPDGPEVGATQRLWSVPVAGGDPVRTDLTGIYTLSVAPDGRLAIVLQRPSEELWLVRNVLGDGARR
jgi:dipeptidyl aminopeptidase/acylaminoacyl peptidase